MLFMEKEIKERKAYFDAKTKKVHPHKFRRTMATRAIEKGMPK